MEHADSKKPKPVWEYFFTTFALVVFTSAFYPLILQNIPSKHMIVMSLWFGIYSVTVVLLLLHWRQVLRVAFQDKLLWLLVGLAVVSILWSNVPFETFKNSVALLGTTAFGIYLAARYTRQELMDLLLLAFGFIAVTSLGFVLLLPSFGLINKANDVVWCGVYINKNTLGAIMALATIAWLLCSIDSLKTHKNIIICIMRFAFFSLSLMILYFSNSITSLIAFLIALIILFLYLVWEHVKNISLVIIIVLGICCFAVWALNNPDELFSILGRNSTLMGRSVLWQAVWELIQERPWLGYGYISYWLGLEGPFSSILYKLYWDPGEYILIWNPTHAHNGYLDLWLQLGLTGLTFYALTLFANLYKAFVLFRKKSILTEMFFLLFLTFMSIHNIAESTILFRNSIFWVLYTAFSAQLSTELKNSKYIYN